MQHISDLGLAVLKAHEGLRLTAYKDGGGVWTIGWGHTGPEVKYRLTITEEQAVALLRKDVAWAEEEVRRLGALPQNQFDALVSLTYNIGAAAFRKSTLARLIRSGASPAVVAEQFPRWNKDNGQVVQGLTNRRHAEKTLFLRDKAPAKGTPPEGEEPAKGKPEAQVQPEPKREVFSEKAPKRPALAVVNLPVLRPPYPPSTTLEVVQTILGERSIVGFQHANGLKPDGIVGPATWGALLGVPQ
jgi:lysozyme